MLSCWFCFLWGVLSWRGNELLTFFYVAHVFVGSSDGGVFIVRWCVDGFSEKAFIGDS